MRQRALEVLERNRRGAWTCPSVGLYPHLWLWDSCFVSIGVARHDAQWAAGEVRALLRGQWANGMVPHMIFAEGGVRDFGSRRMWQSKKYADAPRGMDTSCITQPPLVAVAAQRVARALPVPQARAFLAEVFPRLVAYHGWLYRERDLHHRGLVTLIHPWECGLDTTPPWMRELRRMPAPWWLRLALRLRLGRLIRLLRTDTRYVPAAERPTGGDALRMLVLARRVGRRRFDLRALPPRTSVLVEDLAFNALLVVANRSLVEIARELAMSLPSELENRFRATELALEKLWDDSTGQYYSRNAVTGELIRIPTVATFLPLWSGSPSQERVARLIAHLQEPSGFWPKFPVPSVPTDAPQFDVDRYWKGPTWVNMNWAIIQGLRQYGEQGLALELGRRTLDLIDQSGFAEYFSALDGRAFGADEFSWTAAVVLDLVGE